MVITGSMFMNKKYLDFDKDICHGEHPRYGVKQDDDNYFTNYDYTTLNDDLSKVISDIYEERRRKEKTERIALLEKLVRLYRKILQLRNKPKPAPLEGGHWEHTH